MPRTVVLFGLGTSYPLSLSRLKFTILAPSQASVMTPFEKQSKAIAFLSPYWKHKQKIQKEEAIFKQTGKPNLLNHHTKMILDSHFLALTAIVTVCFYFPSLSDSLVSFCFFPPELILWFYFGVLCRWDISYFSL